MRRQLPFMLWAAVWGIVVVVSATSVWWAISRAGAYVTNQAAPNLPGSTVTATPPPTPTTTPTTTPTATPTTTPRPTPRPTSQTTRRPTPRPSPKDTTTDGPVAVQGSWSGQAGRVTATCRTQQIKLTAAVPADGFTVEIGSRGPETLEIEFHQTGGEREFKVRGVCSTDGPKFTVEQE